MGLKKGGLLVPRMLAEVVYNRRHFALIRGHESAFLLGLRRSNSEASCSTCIGDHAKSFACLLYLKYLTCINHKIDLWHIRDESQEASAWMNLTWSVSAVDAETPRFNGAIASSSCIAEHRSSTFTISSPLRAILR